ncbi:MAG: hypothetical protein ABGY75_20450 [Gemmataceae bacterium]
MQCRVCQWPTTFADLDLISRRCHVCVRLKKKFKTLTTKELKKSAQNLRAAEDLDRGADPTAIVTRWVECGQESDQAEALVNAIVAQRRQRIVRMRDEYDLPENTSDEDVVNQVGRIQRAQVRKSGLYALAFGIGSVVISAALIAYEYHSKEEAQRLRDPLVRVHFGCFPFLWLIVGIFSTLFSVLQIVTGRKEFARATAKTIGIRTGGADDKRRGA